ncbi:hypothetical protein AYL99_02136 [Fonsecaea erecta]|uniref:Ribosome biogenesis protein SLX9 n=1 Tax=Fonsecaea erecta TaxID=1367422 RepID=A0A178ZSW7_9EURO|nr:hypothetical protein AYL99_02136 [Fonsecaea erecta]OAP62909.1 hypothetical protein AYL99_02136 [Fonsecaea erecta]
MSGGQLLAEYRIANGLGADTARTRPLLGDLPVNVSHDQQAVQPFDVGNDDFEDEQDEHDADALTVTTDTTTSTTGESGRRLIPAPRLTKAEARAIKKAAKVAKSQSKAAKNQQRHTINVRTADVSFVAEVLHGTNAGTAGQPAATHPLASDKTIEEVIARNMGFISGIQAHKKMLLSSIAQRRKSERERRKSSIAGAFNQAAGGKKRRFSEGMHECDADDDEMEDLLVAVLVKLGVDGGHARSSSCPANAAAAAAAVNGVSAKKNGAGAGINRASVSSPQQIPGIVTALKALMRDDLERFENEQRETCVRAGGFWRYVGRPVFERMTKIAEELDWKTGVKLKEVNREMEG